MALTNCCRCLVKHVIFKFLRYKVSHHCGNTSARNPPTVGRMKKIQMDDLISSGFWSQIVSGPSIKKYVSQFCRPSTCNYVFFHISSSQLPTITMRTRCRAVVRNHPKHPSTMRRCRSIEANAESTLRQP